MLALPAVSVDDRIPPAPPRRPRRQGAQIWLLVVEHHLRLVLGDREQQLLLAVREIMEQLAFGSLGARANVVERGDGDAALADLGGGAFDDALPSRLSL